MKRIVDAAALVFLENLLMLLFWAFAGTQLSLLRRANKIIR